jgi:hypothetical protein
MEYWNVDLKEEPLTTNMLAPMSRVIFPMSYLPKAHYSIIPVFQHSNWGKAPEFWTLASILLTCWISSLAPPISAD